MANRGWDEKGQGNNEEVGYRRLESGGCEVKPEEALRQLDKYVESIILEATICTELEKLWSKKGALSPEEVGKAHAEMEAKIDEVLQD